MKTKTLIIAAFLMAVSILTFAQKKPTIQFQSKVYDYGLIKESDGAAKCVFSFTNIGDDALIITAVRPSCGCTASNYTQEPILPGGSGIVEASYNPAGRPGPFNKAITVTTNDPDNATIVLTIKGEVIAKTKTKADEYPNKIGNLYFKTNHLAFMDTKDSETKVDTFRLYNNGKNDISIKFNELPAFIKAEIKDPIIKPDMESVIAISYNAKVRADYGYVFDKFFLNTNDDDQPEKLLYVSANIIQDFSWMTEKDKKKAAHIAFENESYDFGTVKEGTNVEYSFVFSNTGKSVLKILKTKASCGCTATDPLKTILKKGEKSEIKTVFNTAGRKGNQHKTITVITNDPDKSVIVLHIQGNVE
jgi:translation initiation factor 1 (eIF-1/SUI1)